MVEVDLASHEKYRVFGTADRLNVVTGEREFHTVSMYTDELKPKDEWELDYMFAEEKEVPYADEVTEGVIWFGLEHNRGFEY